MYICSVQNEIDWHFKEFDVLLIFIGKDRFDHQKTRCRLIIVISLYKNSILRYEEIKIII